MSAAGGVGAPGLLLPLLLLFFLLFPVFLGRPVVPKRPLKKRQSNGDVQTVLMEE